MVDVHARLIRHLEQVAGLDRELEFLPERRGDRRAQGRPPGPRRARAGGGDGVLQDPPLRAAARLRPARGSIPRATTSSATSPRRCPSATASRCASTACAARSSPPSSPTSSSTGPGRRSPSGWARRRAQPASILARGYAVAREVFDMRSFWAAVEALDNQVDAETQLEMLIEGRRLVERATRWLVRANPRRDRHRGDRSATSSRARGCSPKRCPTCSTGATARASTQRARRAHGRRRPA